MTTADLELIYQEAFENLRGLRPDRYQRHEAGLRAVFEAGLKYGNADARAAELRGNA